MIDRYPSVPDMTYNVFSGMMKQEMMGWQWHQLDCMQIICTSLQTDKTSIS